MNIKPKKGDLAGLDSNSASLPGKTCVIRGSFHDECTPSCHSPRKIGLLAP